MSTAQILKSMKGAPKLDSASYNRWCTHFSDALSIFELDDYLSTEKIELNSRNTKNIPENHLIVHKQDRYIRIAISQLVPDVVFHLVNSSYTSKECWDNLRQFYRPNSAQDVDDLLQEFWSFVVEDDIEVDDFVQKLAEIRGRINLIDEKLTPAESSMKKRILGHFIKCCGGFYMSTVVSLRDSNVSFQSVVSSIRASQAVYKELHPTSVVALATKGKGSSSTSSPANVKTCAHCGRRGHLREGCFLWLDTPDGPRWETKNPEKAAKTRRLREKLSKRKQNGRNKPNKSSEENSSCTKNLVSGVQLLHKGYKICTSGRGLSVQTGNGQVIATARPKLGLFCFNTSISSSDNKSKTLPVANIISSDIQDSATRLIHNRLAHVGHHLLDGIDLSRFKLNILKSRASQDIHINKNALSTCEVCNLCKQVEKINRGPVPKSSGILDLVHSDSWGKCRVPGIFGSLHFVTFTDDCSRESMLYLMKNKSEVAHCFQQYKEQKELHSGRSIKALRFDGGSEYKTIDFRGITKQISAPYTQHQNGVSERLNRSIITMVRCMLSHAHLPLRFWDAAALTACYLRNRLPEVSHLRVWGCVCYVLLDDKDPKRYKLKPTSLKGIFVGYCESITQYKVYVPSKPGTNKVVISANVKFMENIFWDWDSSSNIESYSSESLKCHDLGSWLSEDESESESESDTEQISIEAGSISQSQPLANSTEHNPAEEDIDSAELRDMTDSGHYSQKDSQVSNLRRSNRIRKQIEPRSAWQLVQRALHTHTEVSIPRSYSEAVNGLEGSNWQIAIDDEINSLQSKNVFSPVTHVPHGRKPVGSRWVFSVKSDGRYKARLVAQGFSQVYGVDYFDTYSPTLRMDSLRILLAVATFHDWEIDQVDVKTAYLEGDLQEEVYIKRPEGMSGTDYIRVNKALYGLKQSGRAWYEKLANKLLSLGFAKSEYDHCIHIHSTMQVVIGVYVDDLVICGKLVKDVVDIKKKLSSFFPIKDLGSIDTIIGWKVTRDRTTRTLRISQAHYLADKIRSFGLEEAKVISSPLEGYSGILPKQNNEKPADESAYASAIGSLYASNSTRPDISFAVSQLSSFNSSPTFRHWNSVCRVLRYIKGTIGYQVTYNFGPLSSKLSQDKKATLYSDSDFASDITTRKSVSGYIMMLGSGPICWQSRRQKSVSTSTAEAEYVALCEAAKQAVWVTGYLKELHLADLLIDTDGIFTFTDNQSALAIPKGANTAKTKHIDIAYHYVRECVLKNLVNLKYIPTANMLADILTKPLPNSKAKPLSEQIFKA